MRYESDGHTRPATLDDIVPGTVVRSPASDGAIYAWNDSIVLGTVKLTSGKTSIDCVKIARPYAYASVPCDINPGTVLIGHGIVEPTFEQFVQHYHVVLDSRGEPVRMTA